VNANIGKFVSATDVLFEIVNNEKLFLDLVLFEKDVEKVAKNQKIHFFINNETEQHSAVVYQISKSVNEDKTYKVIANVTDVCKNIIPGMYVNAFIEASSNSVSCLPSDAIVSFEQKDYILVFEKNKKEDGKDFTEYKMIQVKKGVTDSGFTEIILPEKYSAVTFKVVVKGAYNLLSAMKNAGEMSC
jgi:cobalt-zinc-cadmium efflux system membrane fusion protein